MAKAFIPLSTKKSQAITIVYYIAQDAHKVTNHRTIILIKSYDQI